MVAEPILVRYFVYQVNQQVFKLLYPVQQVRFSNPNLVNLVLYATNRIFLFAEPYLFALELLGKYQWNSVQVWLFTHTDDIRFARSNGFVIFVFFKYSLKSLHCRLSKHFLRHFPYSLAPCRCSILSGLELKLMIFCLKGFIFIHGKVNLSNSLVTPN